MAILILFSLLVIVQEELNLLLEKITSQIALLIPHYMQLMLILEFKTITYIIHGLSCASE